MSPKHSHGGPLRSKTLDPATEKALRALASGGDPAAFLDGLKKAFLQGHDGAMRFIKTQKLLNKPRDLAVVRFLGDALSTWAHDAPLPAPLRRQIRRHVAVCVRVQELFAYLDDGTAGSRLWDLPRDHRTLLVLDSIERAHWATQTALERAASTDPVEERGYEGAFLMANHVRLHCDKALLVLRASARATDGRNSAPPPSGVLEDLLALAGIAESLASAFDCYTYFGWTLSVEDTRLHLHPGFADLDLARHWAARRTFTAATRDLHEFGEKLNVLFAREARRADLQLEHSSIDGFLNATPNRPLVEATRALAASDVVRRRGYVDEVFDPTSPLTFGHEKVSVDDLLSAWRALLTAVWSVRVWQAAARQRAVDLGFAPSLFARRGLEQFLMAEMAISQSRADAIIRQLSGRLDTSFDFFFSPLAELDDGRLAFSPTAVELGRWQRNIFKVAARSGDGGLAVRGARPLAQLTQLLEQHGWRAKANIDLGVTDVDLAFFRDGRLFLAQVKVVVEPDGVYETWAVLQKLRHAARQASAAQAADAVGRTCEALGVSPRVRERGVVFFLLTNAWEFTGAQVNGFPVVDFTYLRTLVTGGSIMFADEDGPLELRLPRGGDRAERVATLLQSPFQRSLSRRPTVLMREVSVGSYTLVVGMTSGGPSMNRPPSSTGGG